MTAAKNELMKSEILRLHLVNRVVLPDAGLIRMSPASWSKEESNENRRRVLAEHDTIFNAIAERDSRTAKAAMEQHIQDLINKNLNAMAIADGDHYTRVLTEEELAYGS
jgi:DNA-binding GntR family transcriptional regulator